MQDELGSELGILERPEEKEPSVDVQENKSVVTWQEGVDLKKPKTPHLKTRWQPRKEDP